jgi:hypothetical protein
MTRRAGKERHQKAEVVSFRKVISKHREDDFVREVLAEVVPFKGGWFCTHELAVPGEIHFQFSDHDGESQLEARYVSGQPMDGRYQRKNVLSARS